MKGFKSSSNRLIRLFKEGRENWKKIALERQQKLRALEIKVRDLSQSREKWKQRAMTAEKELRLLHASADGQKKGKKLKNR